MSPEERKIEEKHLRKTLRLIRKEQALAKQDAEESLRALEYARGFDPDQVPAREMLYWTAMRTQANLALAEKKPYFTRLDFQEDGFAPETFYIGKNAVIESETLRVAVVDWRAPIANLYYSGQLGRVSYDAPDGAIRGALTCKRQIEIENGALVSIFDVDMADMDRHLRAVLSAMTGERLREIVTSIQAEQNYVIRHPLNTSLIVQGVAGSGKTTIALHRIAYLLYAFSNKLRPEHMLILAPSPLFLRFIAGVLPDLGVENARQTTFLGWARALFGDILPKNVVFREYADAYTEEFASIRRVKGSARLAERLHDWLDEYENAFCPALDVAFGPITVFTAQRVRAFLLVDEKPFAMARRLREFEKQLTDGVIGARNMILNMMERDYQRRAAACAEFPDENEKRARIRALGAARDKAVEDVRARVKPFIRKIMARFPTTDALALYRAFWQAHKDDAELGAAAKHTLAYLETGDALDPEDMAAVGLIARRMVELPREDVRHIVIDEAQNFSIMQMLLIRALAPKATWTVVGDLMQQADNPAAIPDWDALQDAVFMGKVVRHDLVTSYRSTVEIMCAAQSVADRYPIPGVLPARPVLRRGDDVRMHIVHTEQSRAATIAELVGAWRADGFQTTAILVDDEAMQTSLLSALPEALQADALDADAATYHPGVHVALASAVKGMEFDCVVIAQAERFRDDAPDARRAYVFLTRALHRLALVSLDAPSRIFGEIAVSG